MKFIFAFCLAVCSLTAIAQKDCGSELYLRQLIERDALSVKSPVDPNIDRPRLLTGPEIVSGVFGSSQPMAVITIPVVVHVVYNNESGNISDAQVMSQIKALNDDFRRLNSDTTHTPEQFREVAADCFIQFQLATVDPSGNATTGIVRKKTSMQLFGLDDRIKKSAIGGDDAWDSNRYLNIWVGNLAGGLVGYSSPPGGPSSTDGIVIRPTAFGTTGTVSAPLHKGRTTTHEVGHWLGLQHIWGDMYCGDDNVADTPPQQMASRGCPAKGASSCNNKGNMFMNYMDFTNDDCMNMFTAGQRDRMRASFKPGSARFALLASNATGTPKPVAEIPKQEEKIIVSQVKVFPNPATDQLVLSIPESKVQMKLSYRISNHLGQVVKHGAITQMNTSIRVGDLRNGMYYVSIDGSVKETAIRFVKH